MLNIVRTAGSPLPVRAGDRLLMVGPPGFRMRGMILAWLAADPAVRSWWAARLGQDPPPGWLPRSSGAVAIEALVERGRGVAVYATTRRDHPEITPDEADRIGEGLVEHPEALQAVTQFAALGMLARDVPGSDGPDAADEAGRTPRPEGHEGIEAVDFGALYEHPHLRRFAYSELGRMTQDQVENAIRRGEAGLATRGTPMSMGSAIDYIDACRRAQAEGREMPPCPS